MEPPVETLDEAIAAWLADPHGDPWSSAEQRARGLLRRVLSRERRRTHPVTPPTDPTDPIKSYEIGSRFD